MKKVISLMVMLSTFAFAASVAAQPAIVIGNAVAPEGSTDPVKIPLSWDNIDDTNDPNIVVGVQTLVSFDNTNLSVDTSECIPNPPNGGWTCTDLGDGTVELFYFSAQNAPAPDASLGTLNFTVTGAPVGTYVIGLPSEKYSNAAFQPVPANGSVEGFIEIQGAVFEGTPSGLESMSVIQGQPDPTGTLTIDNIGANGTTLSGSCSVTGNPTVFYVDSGPNFSVTRGNDGSTTPHVVLVACDSDQPIALHTGELTCDPDGDDNPIETYDLSCNITDGPQPVYGSTPGPGSTIEMEAVWEDDPIPPATIVVNNDNGATAGELVSILSGSCEISGAQQIELAAVDFDIEAQGAPVTQTLTCDSSVEGFYTATVSCPNNDAQNSNPQYTVECDVGPQRPAVFASNPTNGSTIDMTPGDVKEGDTIPDQSLIIFNVVDPDGQNLSIDCGFDGDPGEITTNFEGTQLIEAGQDFEIGFSCPNDVVADSTASYVCDWEGVDKPNDQTGSAESGRATWTYLCDVRDAEAVVVSDPPSGTTITKQVPGGSTGQFDIAFFVDPDEGVDGTLLSCEPDDAVNFQVTSPASFPATIPSDGVLPVTVIGSDPGGVDELSTVLRCVYEDSNTPEGGTEWTYNLVMEIGSFATFRVSKMFEDGNPGTVRVELNCNNGLPLNQGFNISESQDVNFVLGDFSDGEPDCTITEIDFEGYTTTYTASGESNPSDDGDGCYFENVSRGDVNECQLYNEVDPVPVVVSKDWIVEGNDGNAFDLEATITVSSTSEIVGGYPCINKDDNRDYGRYCRHLKFTGPGSSSQTVMVYPEWDGVMVYLEEEVAESYIASQDDCGGDVTIYPADGASCTFTNSVFFEGIPTLNQYGLAVMVLLMLGIGMVGFRRFS